MRCRDDRFWISTTSTSCISIFNISGCVCLVDGKTVVSGGNDGFVHITDLEGGYSNGSADM